MIRSLYTASTAMYAQQLNIDTISNNLSNVNTTGFKKSRPVFQDLLYSKLPAPDVGNTPSTLELGTGVRVVATRRDYSDGALVETEQPLDVALQGRGFLLVRLQSGATAYTRSGSLQLLDGRLVNSSGYPVLNTNGSEISVASGIGELSVDAEGEVFGLTENGSKQSVGRLGVGIPANPQSLRAYGDGLYTTSESINPGTPGEGGRARIIPRFLEAANVQVVEEMVNLITAQRAYEVGSKAIQAADDMLGQANNLRR